MTKQTTFGTILVKHATKAGERFTLKLTFVDRAEYDKTLVILAGVKEVEIAEHSFNASLYTADKAIEDVKFWLLDGR